MFLVVFHDIKHCGVILAGNPSLPEMVVFGHAEFIFWCLRKTYTTPERKCTTNKCGDIFETSFYLVKCRSKKGKLHVDARQNKNQLYPTPIRMPAPSGIKYSTCFSLTWVTRKRSLPSSCYRVVVLWRMYISGGEIYAQMGVDENCETSQPPKISTGVMLLRPSLVIYEDLMRYARSKCDDCEHEKVT